MKLPFPLQESEEIQVVCRRHWLYLYPRLLLLLIVAIAPVVALWVVLRTAGASDGAGAKIGIAATVIWLLFWAVRIFLFKYRYDNDVWAVTNQRIIDSVRTNPFSLRIATADLIDVVDTSVDRSGVLRTMFDYGDISCETAGERQKFALSAIPNPREIHALIDKMRDRSRTETYRGPQPG